VGRLSREADEVRRLRLRAQRLEGAPRAAVADVVRALVGLQAQDRNAALLAVGARAPGASVASVEDALSGERSVVRTWAMRGTIHLLAAEDLPLALAVFGPLQLRRSRRRLAELGLPADAAERSTVEAAAVLEEEGPLTRHELAERLRARGVPVSAAGQAPIAVVHRAAVAGVLCEVGVRGRDPVYARIDPGPLPDREAALAELARRYHAAHAPAGSEDFATWSGLPAADVRHAWQAVRAETAGAGDEPGGASRADAVSGERGATSRGGGGGIGGPAGRVRLLPAYDEWLLGWASRGFVLAAEHVRRPLPGGGIVRPAAIADGRVFATWRLDRPRRRVEVAPFGPVPQAVRDGLDAEVEAVSRFLGATLSLAVP